jgi:hypothetical protein
MGIWLEPWKMHTLILWKMQNTGTWNQCLPYMYILHIHFVSSTSNIMSSLKYVILWHYIVDDSETSDISQGDVSWNRYSHNSKYEMGTFLKTICYDQEKRYTYEKLTENLKWQKNASLRSRHFHLNCRLVIWISTFDVQQYSW